MKLETKFNIGDIVYLKIFEPSHKSTICGISPFTGKANQAGGGTTETKQGHWIVKYHLVDCVGHFDEKDLFSSKEELLKHLSDTIN